MAEASKRDQVKAMIEEGTHTKKDIAAALDMSEGSVSSQMTYLRWMGNNIIYDEDKVLSFVDEEEFKQWEAEKAANRKSGSTSTKDPQERANALAKTIEKQEKQLANWEKKLSDAEGAQVDEPDNEELQELVDEAEANITLMKIKIKRNKATAADLPDPVEEVVEEEVAEEADLL